MSGFCEKSKYIWQDKGSFYDCTTNDCRIFRKSFKIDKKPKSAVMHIFADSAYILYINGEKVRRVVSFSPDRPVYFEENVESYLTPGENVIAVMCMHRGYQTLFSDCRVPALRAELEMTFSGDRKEFIYTDESFKVRENKTYGSLGVRFSGGKGCIECADNRSDIYGWQTTGFDDSGWDNAAVQSCEHAFGEPALMRACPGEEKSIPAKAIIAAGAGTECENKPYPVSVAEETENYKVNLVYGLGSECEIKPLDKGDFSYITADFGREITGYIRLELDSYGGDVTDIVFSEELKSDKPVISGLARFIAKDGENVFETYFDRNTFRYVTIILRNHIRTNLVKKITAYTSKGFLGDSEEEEIANECISEVLLSGPGYAGGSDISCARYILDSCITCVQPEYTKDILDAIGFSQDGNGFIKPGFPGGNPDYNRLGTVMYILSVCEYVEASGDLDYAKKCLNRLIPALDAYDDIESVFVGDALGKLLFSGAVKKVCGIAKKLDEKILYEYLRTKSKKLTKAIKQKHLSKSGVYCNTINEDGTPSEISCDINSAAILYIASKSEIKGLCEAVLDYVNKSTLTPSALHSPMFVKAARMAGREDIAELVASEFESNKAYFTAMYELKKEGGK